MQASFNEPFIISKYIIYYLQSESDEPGEGPQIETRSRAQRRRGNGRNRIEHGGVASNSSRSFNTQNRNTTTLRATNSNPSRTSTLIAGRMVNGVPQLGAMTLEILNTYNQSMDSLVNEPAGILPNETSASNMDISAELDNELPEIINHIPHDYEDINLNSMQCIKLFKCIFEHFCNKSSTLRNFESNKFIWKSHTLLLD